MYFHQKNYQNMKGLQRLQIPDPSHIQQKSFYSQNSSKDQTNKQKSQYSFIIKQKIHLVNEQNKKLLDISRQLNQSSILRYNNQKISPIIFNIQEQMKNAFNELIQGIQQFYLDIDNKIKQIGVYLTKISNADTNQNSFHHIFQDSFYKTKYQNSKGHNVSDKQYLKRNSERLEILQKDLEDTKNNQKKLLHIIEKLIQKYQITNQTTLRQDPFLKKKLQNLNNTQTQKVQNQQQKISIPSKDKAFNKSQKHLIHNYSTQSSYINDKNIHLNESIYHGLKKIQQQPTRQQLFGNSNVSVHSYGLSDVPEEKDDPCFIRKIYSKQSQSLSKMSLKGHNQFFQFKARQEKEEIPNKSHRQAFLISNLKR